MSQKKKSASKIDYNKVIAEARQAHEEWEQEHPQMTGAEIRAQSDAWWAKQMKISEGLFADDDAQLLRALGFTEASLAKFLKLNPEAMDYLLGRKF